MHSESSLAMPYLPRKIKKDIQQEKSKNKAMNKNQNLLSMLNRGLSTINERASMKNEGRSEPMVMIKELNQNLEEMEQEKDGANKSEMEQRRIRKIQLFQGLQLRRNSS